jgi:DNA polymerase-3 subunit delta'
MTGGLPAALVGHHAAQAQILTDLASGTLPHALLIQGPKGIGKRLFADRLALRLLCGPNPADSASARLTFNPLHPAALQWREGANPNYFALQPAEGKSSIRIEAVREVMGTLSLASESWRVVVVDAAEDLTDGAANALLKTLEEPGRHTLIMLLSNAPSKLLPTLISRCRQVRLSPLSSADVATVLARLDLEDADAATLTLLSEGSPGRGAAFAAGGGLKALRALQSFFANLGKADAASVVALSSALAVKDKDVDLTSQAFPMLLWWLAQLGRCAAGGTVSLPPEMAEVVTLACSAASADIWADLYHSTQQRGLEQSTYNYTLQLALEMALTDVITSLKSAQKAA